jgi:hypothetical protein
MILICLLCIDLLLDSKIQVDKLACDCQNQPSKKTCPNTKYKIVIRHLLKGSNKKWLNIYVNIKFLVLL